MCVVPVRRAPLLQPIKLDPSIPLTIEWANTYSRFPEHGTVDSASNTTKRNLFLLQVGNVMFHRVLAVNYQASAANRKLPLFGGFKIETVNVLFKPNTTHADLTVGMVFYASQQSGYCAVTLASSRGRQQTFDLRSESPDIPVKRLFRYNDEKISPCDLFYPYNLDTIQANNNITWPNATSDLIRIEHDG